MNNNWKEVTKEEARFIAVQADYIRNKKQKLIDCTLEEWCKKYEATVFPEHIKKFKEKTND